MAEFVGSTPVEDTLFTNVLPPNLTTSPKAYAVPAAYSPWAEKPVVNTSQLVVSALGVEVFV